MIVQNPVVIDEETLKRMARAVRGGIRHIYLHWTAGNYGQVYDDYHLSIDRDGTVYATCDNLLEFKAHTWRRNSGSVGICLCCGAFGHCWTPARRNAWEVDRANEVPHAPQPDAALIDFGPEPPTGEQINAMARVVAILCGELCLPIDEESVITHCEAAYLDGYGPGCGDPETRWDLWFLPDAALHGELVPGGELIREKAILCQCDMALERALQ